MAPHRCLRSRQRGVATLAVVVLLLLALGLAIVAAQRAIGVEQRTSENQYRSTQAFEAAEAGVDWALARLNDATPIDDDCRPSAAPGAIPFRDRHLPFDAAAGAARPATWDDGGIVTPLAAACVHGEAGWRCSCPGSGAPLLDAPARGPTAPAFSIAFAAGPRDGIVRVVATGCTRSSGLCAPVGDDAHEASARIETAFALLPGLRAAPQAALTARTSVVAGGAPLGVHNRDAASGLALHAGGSIVAGALRLTVPAGSAAGESVLAGDPTLAGLDGDAFFARYLGMDVRSWSEQPAVTRVACDGDCSAAIAGAAATGATLIAIDGDLALAGPLALGTPERPVAVVASGTARLRGAVTIFGALLADGIDWHSATAPAALVRGAALSAAGYAGDAGADIVYDNEILDRLRRGSGSYVRVNGSWKDF